MNPTTQTAIPQSFNLLSMLPWLIPIGMGLVLTLKTKLGQSVSLLWKKIVGSLYFTLVVQQNSNMYDWLIEELGGIEQIATKVTDLKIIWYSNQIEVLDNSYSETKWDKRIKVNVRFIGQKLKKDDPIDASINLTVRSKHRQLLMELYKQAQDSRLARFKNNIELIKIQDDGSQISKMKHKRMLSSLIDDEGVFQNLLDDIKLFIESEEEYKRLGLPWKRGYLVHGPPGNGKTAVVFCIASQLGIPLTIIEGSADTCAKQLESTSRQSIVVIDEADKEFGKSNSFLEQLQSSNEESSDSAAVANQSRLLKAMDGIESADGQIVVLTANNLESLEGPLLRPGRIDKYVYVDNCSEKQAHEMFIRFVADQPENAAKFAIQCRDRRFCMSEVREHVMLYRHDIPTLLSTPLVPWTERVQELAAKP